MEIEFRKLFRNASESLLRMRVVSGRMLARECTTCQRVLSVWVILGPGQGLNNLNNKVELV